MGRVARRVERLFDLDGQIGWLLGAEQACAALHPEDVDLVLATGPPFIAFRLAERVARRLARPFALDYRDLWTRNPHSSRRADRRQTKLERNLLASAGAVTVVSPSLAKSLDAQFGVGAKIQIVSNGYDAEDIAGVVPIDFGHFAIVYAGTFYSPKRVIQPVIAALQRMKERGSVPTSAWKFHYYGPQGEHVLDAVRGSGIEENVVIHGLVFRTEVLSALRGAGLSVVITSVEDEGTLEDKSIVTGKVFDAIGLGKPSLIVAPPGSDLEAILQLTGLGHRFSGKEVEEMATFLEESINGKNPTPAIPEAYSWPAIAKRLDEVLSATAWCRT
jgi:glycosyltransferase involved in cell wall biosynthesis